MINNIQSLLLLAEKLGIDTSDFDGNTIAEAIVFIANNISLSNSQITVEHDGNGNVTLNIE